MEGTIFDIQRFCIHDGPGIRTTVFLKGCPLRCQWCSNPESQEAYPQLMINSEKCMRCNSCVTLCPKRALSRADDGTLTLNRMDCDMCGMCVAVCPRACIVKKGDTKRVEDVISLLMRDRQAYESSGGGVTFSGGEPFAQHTFLLALLKSAREHGMTTAVETTLCAPWRAIVASLAHIDHILCDLKHTDDAVHAAWTGVPCGVIKDNLSRLLEMHDDVTVRIPVIPGFNTDDRAREGFRAYFSNVPPVRVELLRYHVFGEKKYAMLGRKYPASDVDAARTDEDAKALRASLKDIVSDVWIGG